MSGSEAYSFLLELRQRWRRQELFALFLLSLAISIPIAALLQLIFAGGWLWLLACMALSLPILLMLRKEWLVNNRTVVRTLDQSHPELQESTGLLLKPDDQLGLLEKLQVRKIATHLSRLATPNPAIPRIKKYLLLLSGSLILSFLIYYFGPVMLTGNTNGKAQLKTSAPGEVEIVLPAVADFNLRIKPPSYMKLSDREQRQFNIKAEQAAMIEWKLNITGDPASVELIFNDSSAVKMNRNTGTDTWSAGKKISRNGFYQLRIDNSLSPLYQFEMIPDKAPVISLQRPAPATLIDYGQSTRVPVDAEIMDDYGISATSIIMTVASGSGEAVKFTEQEIRFPGFRAGSRKSALKNTLDLASLGMRPGDELYFYVKATDLLKQESRSDIFTVRLEDTAALMSMDGMMSGVDLKPAFFRSQRQIIIETEQLLKGRDTMSKEAFNNKCNDLGIDQKLLRLRYGKFLGEESETSIGEDGNTGHEGHEDEEHEEEIDIKDFNNAEKIIDRYAHKHDIAEDATFFDPQTKRDLKATLAEMWKAELRLRTYLPAEALPFEYKALRLLKDLQQKSREYVAKTSTRLPPLNPAEKRLSGETDKVLQPLLRDELKFSNNISERLRKSLGILAVKADETLPGKFIIIEDSLQENLRVAAGQLSLKAASDPARFLAGFEAMQTILLGRGTRKETTLAGKALQELLRRQTPVPAASATSANQALSEQYFYYLNKRAGS